ncbi:MAG: 3D domain-containing protein [Kofleriaceae bacterium]
MPEPVALAAPAPAALPPPPPAPPPPTPIGEFQITFYYIIHEAEMAAPANDNALADSEDQSLAAMGPLTPPADLVPLRAQDCTPLAHVTKAFAGQVAMQGTGRLRDGRMVNVATGCKCGRPCFHVLQRHRTWGTGGSGRALVPFRSVAVDPKVIPMGSLLYLPALDGVRMPGPPGVGAFIHDGCVVAVDTGGGIQGQQLDLFVGRRAYYKGLARRGGSHAWSKHAEVWDGAGRCQQEGGKVRRASPGAS